MWLKVLVILSVAYFAHVASLKSNKKCEKGSLDKLVLDELLAKAQISSQCLKEARNVFKAKYGPKKFYIKGPFQRDESKSIGRLPDRVTISNPNVTKNVFEIFQGLISFVHISFDEISATDGKALVKVINDNLSASLSYLTIENCKENVLDELKSKFENVTALRFSTNFPNDQGTVSSNAATFAEIFPNLAVLCLGQTRVPDWKVIGNTYSKLTSLSLKSPVVEGSNAPNESLVEDLLKNSRKITELSLIEPSLWLLKTARQKLPKLKSLSLSLTRKFPKSKRDVRFDHVKELTIHSNGVVPRNVQFDHLETLNIHVDSEFTDQWVDFLESQVNVGIRHLNINMESVPVKSFLSIASTLNKLKTASVTCKREFSVAEIVHFVKKLKSAETINMKILMEKAQHNKLKSKLSHKWKIVSLNADPLEETYLIDFELERLESVEHGDDEEDEDNNENTGDDDNDEDSEEGEDENDGNGDEENGSSSLTHNPIVILSTALIFTLTIFFQLE